MEKIRSKIIIVLLLMLCCHSYGQNRYFRAISFNATTYDTYHDRWNDWGEPEPTNVLIHFNSDFNLNIVTIYSDILQVYRLKEVVKKYIDSDGDYTVLLGFIDQDDDIGIMKWVEKPSGKITIYIVFKKIAWCYEVKEVE